MLGENIKILRKQKGYSQETMAEQLNVVRQTISKWEKGYSVPDADMLERIAGLFEVSVSELLGSPIIEEEKATDTAEIVKQLAIINEQLAKQSRSRKRVWKNVLITIGVIVLAYIVLNVLLIFLFGAVKSSKSSTSTSTVELYCTLNDEKYVYRITYDDNNRVLETGGDAWIYNQLQVEKYKDADALIEQIEDYFTERGGTCEVVGDKKSE